VQDDLGCAGAGMARAEKPSNDDLGFPMCAGVCALSWVGAKKGETKSRGRSLIGCM